MQKLNPLHILSLLFIGISSSGCVTHGELLNFSEGPPFSIVPEPITELPELKIQPDDQLSITVQALDLEVVVPFNIDPLLANRGNIGNGDVRPLLGYLVDREGFIDFPVLGRIKAGGLTIGELRDSIVLKLDPKYVRNPVVIVRYLNYRITVLGEVKTPGNFSISNERVTIFDILGRAGDVSAYADRTNIIIIRERDGMRTFGKINLKDRDIFSSPYFYLQQNDLIYVQPLSEKTASLRDQSQRLLPWLSVITSLTTLVITITSLK